VNSPDVKESIKNQFIVVGFQFNLDKEYLDLTYVLLSFHQIALLDKAEFCIESVLQSMRVSLKLYEYKLFYC